MNTYNNSKINADYLKNVFGVNLTATLKSKNITLKEVATLMNVSERTVYTWVGGLDIPPFKRYVLLCEVLDVSLDSLVKY